MYDLRLTINVQLTTYNLNLKEMALNDILQKITEEADKKTAFMKQVASKEIKKIEEEAKAKAEAKKKEIEEKIEINSISIIKKSKTLAQMAGRSQTLKEKREVIDKAYEEVESELNSMEDSKYSELMSKMLRHVMKSAQKGTLIVPADRKKQMQDALSKANADFQIESDTDEFKGGFVVASGKVEINLSFPYLIQRVVRPATELEVAKILFP